MGRRGFGMVSARSEIYRLQGMQNDDRERLRSWQYAAKCLAELVSAKKYKAAKELAEKVASASIWRDPPFKVPEDWSGNFFNHGRGEALVPVLRMRLVRRIKPSRGPQQ